MRNTGREEGMRQYELAIRIAQVHHLVDERKYKKALAVIQTLDMRQVRSLSDLKVFADVYTKTEQYEAAKALYLKMYHRSPTKRILHRLVTLSIRTGTLGDAETYYQEFTRMNPNARDALILRYRLENAKGASVEKLIKILQDLKKEEYIEEWAYELAKLYCRAGRVQECLEECKDILLWFGSGEIVERAKFLMDHLQDTNLEQYYNDKDFTLAKKEEPNPEDTGSLPDLDEFIKERKAQKREERRAEKAARKAEEAYDYEEDEFFDDGVELKQADSQVQEKAEVEKKGEAKISAVSHDETEDEFIDDYEDDDFEQDGMAFPQIAKNSIQILSGIFRIGKKGTAAQADRRKKEAIEAKQADRPKRETTAAMQADRLKREAAGAAQANKPKREAAGAAQANKPKREVIGAAQTIGKETVKRQKPQSGTEKGIEEQVKLEPKRSLAKLSGREGQEHSIDGSVNMELGIDPESESTDALIPAAGLEGETESTERHGLMPELKPGGWNMPPAVRKDEKNDWGDRVDVLAERRRGIGESIARDEMAGSLSLEARVDALAERRKETDLETFRTRNLGIKAEMPEKRRPFVEPESAGNRGADTKAAISEKNGRKSVVPEGSDPKDKGRMTEKAKPGFGMEATERRKPVAQTDPVREQTSGEKKGEKYVYSQSGTGITQDLAREIAAIYEMEHREREQLKEEQAKEQKKERAASEAALAVTEKRGQAAPVTDGNRDQTVLAEGEGKTRQDLAAHEIKESVVLKISGKEGQAALAADKRKMQADPNMDEEKMQADSGVGEESPQTDLEMDETQNPSALEGNGKTKNFATNVVERMTQAIQKSTVRHYIPYEAEEMRGKDSQKEKGSGEKQQRPVSRVAEVAKNRLLEEQQNRKHPIQGNVSGENRQHPEPPGEKGMFYGTVRQEGISGQGASINMETAMTENEKDETDLLKELLEEDIQDPEYPSEAAPPFKRNHENSILEGEGLAGKETLDTEETFAQGTGWDDRQGNMETVKEAERSLPEDADWEQETEMGWPEEQEEADRTKDGELNADKALEEAAWGAGADIDVLKVPEGQTAEPIMELEALQELQDAEMAEELISEVRIPQEIEENPELTAGQRKTSETEVVQEVGQQESVSFNAGAEDAIREWGLQTGWPEEPESWGENEEALEPEAELQEDTEQWGEEAEPELDMELQEDPERWGEEAEVQEIASELEHYKAPDIPVVTTDYAEMPEIPFDDLPTTKALHKSFQDVLLLIAGEREPCHFALMGGGTEKVVGISKRIVAVMKNNGYLSKGRIAKIYAEQLNKMDLISFREQLKGNCLLVEGASELLFPTITKIFSIMEEYYGDLIVIFADEGAELDQLFRFVPALVRKFSYIIDISQYTEEDCQLPIP